MDLRNICSLCQCLCSPDVKVTTLLGVREVLALQNLEFPILLDEREDDQTIVLEPLGLAGDSANDGSLCRGYMTWSETAKQSCIKD